MKSSRRGPLARAAFLLLLVACGSRTGLFGTEDDTVGLLPDGGLPPLPDGGFRDGPIGFDSPFQPDAPLPPIDAAPRPDANHTDCPDAEATLVYVVTDNNELFSFFPTDGTFKFISNLSCPAPMGANPFSMAVDRKGVAYVEFTDHRLYRVSTATGACISTTFQPDQQGFGEFGMGFATNSVGPTEELFVAGTAPVDPMTGNVIGPSPGLGRVTPATFVLTKVGNFVPDIENAELTGTGDGRLFAFYNKQTNPQLGNPPPSFIGEIDTSTAHLIAETPFPTVGQGVGWAFAFWGGDFYMFTAASQSSGSTVTRWRPSDNSVNVVTSLPSNIVGAGVSTCAPAQ